MNPAVEQWREATRRKRQEQERLWADLSRAVEQMVRQLGSGQHHEAADSARVALELEYALTGSCDVTSELLDALGVTVEGETL